MQASATRVATAAAPQRHCSTYDSDAIARRTASTSPPKGAAARTPLELAYLGSSGHATASPNGASSSSSSTKAISVETFQSHEELRVLRAIVAREQALDDLLDCCSAFEADDADDASVALLETLLRVRVCSLDVVDAVAGWRRRMVQVLPFHWRSVNYLLKMTCDLDFVSRSRLALTALDGVRLAKRNPFSTIGGLDASMRVCWEFELPDATDLPVLLDSTALAPAHVCVDVPSKVRLAEHMLVLEERRFGKLSRVEAARVDHRLETLVKREAAFATKSRFGSLERRSEA